jgi:hypothetical protein
MQRGWVSGQERHPCKSRVCAVPFFRTKLRGMEYGHALCDSLPNPDYAIGAPFTVRLPVDAP